MEKYLDGSESFMKEGYQKNYNSLFIAAMFAWLLGMAAYYIG
jgi:hypothetical protein